MLYINLMVLSPSYRLLAIITIGLGMGDEQLTREIPISNTIGGEDMTETEIADTTAAS